MGKREQEALARVPLFSGLSRRHRKRLGDGMQEVRYMEGASVVKEGQEGETFYIILEGEAMVVGQGGATVNRLQPGDFFGEISLLDGGARTATVVAETPMTMLELKRREFLQMIEDEPEVAVKLLSHTASLLRRTERSLAG